MLYLRKIISTISDYKQLKINDMKKIALFLLFAIIAAIAPLTLFAQNGVHNGHRYVDLGLPSGTKWSDCNVGAKAKTNYGYYYAWGETTRKTNYSWSTYKYGKNYDKLTKYTDSYCGKNGFADNKNELDFSDDVAQKLWGGKWRIPSEEQFEELINYTKQRWTRVNGVKGLFFIGKNGNSIFLPAAGCREGNSLCCSNSVGHYWSRTLDVNISCKAEQLEFYSDDIVFVRSDHDVADYFRSHGRPIRPVYDKNTPVESASKLKVSGTDNGHGYVDLGLPSGTKWADRNVGASSPTQYGNYYAWGETTTKSNYDWDTYKYGKLKFYERVIVDSAVERKYELTKYCTDLDYGKNGFKDNKKELDFADDVAHALWGGKWGIPSEEQFDELIEYTKHKWVSINDKWGYLFTGRNGNSIFLPAAGYRYDTSLNYAGSYGFYWSRTLYADYPVNAYYLSFGSGYVYVDYGGYGDNRCYGHTVRPVCP